MNMNTYAVVIPLRFNDGTDVPGQIIEQIEGDMLHLCSGFTRVGPVTGKCRMQDGTIKSDVSTQYILSGPKKTDLLAFAKVWAAILSQETLYLERRGTAVLVPGVCHRDDV